jgi:hypothetical protein
MRKQLAACLLAALALLAVPVFAADTTIAVEPETTKVSADLAVDDFLLVGIVSTELVTAKFCDVPTIGCSQENADCGVIPQHCHCKAGGGTLTCVLNPSGGGGPVE